jgi:2-polyprenyl-3-methyl-5-hydroxy-6-metoxy-1,4-benzoquinol methylase
MKAVRSAKAYIKSAFPGGVEVYRKVRAALAPRRPDLRAVFTDIYRHNGWQDAESVSGRGSTLAHTEVVRGELPRLLGELGARSLLDAPCGDFNWMRHVALGGVAYVGADVVPEMIERNRREYGGEGRDFLVLDLTRDRLPRADAILCRDCLIHLSFADALRALDNFRRSGARHLLATTHTSVRENADIETGAWRLLNLQLPPFNLPPPARLVVENAELSKCLGVWRLKG